MNLRSLIKNDKFLFLAEQSVFSGITLVTSLVLAKVSGVEKFGQFAGVVLVSYMLLSVSYAVIIQPVQTTGSSKTQDSGYKTFNLALLAIITLIVSVLTGGAIPVMAHLYGFSPMFILAGGLYCILFMAFDFFRKWFMTSGRLWPLTGGTFFLGLGHLVAFGAVYALKPEPSAITAIMAAAFVPAVIFQIFQYGPSLKISADFRAFANEHASQAKWLLPSSLIQWWSGNFFIMTAGMFLGSSVLGIFRLVQSIFGIFNLLLQAYENYLTPKAARLYDTDPQASVLTIRKESGRLLGGLFVVLALLAVISYIVISHQDVASKEAVQAVMGMTLLYVVIILNYPVRILIRVTGQNHLFFHAYLISLAFSLLVFKYFITQWGISGALAGLTGSQLLMMVYWQYHLYKNKTQIWKSFI